jgi:hypothetical protein
MTLLTQREAALALRLSERTSERMRVTGNGPRFVKCNRNIRYQQQDLEQWIAGRVSNSSTYLLLRLSGAPEQPRKTDRGQSSARRRSVSSQNRYFLRAADFRRTKQRVTSRR